MNFVSRLIPSEDLLPGMRLAMETKRAAASSGKKKKRAREEAAEGSAAIATASSIAAPEGHAAERAVHSKDIHPQAAASVDNSISRVEKAPKSTHTSSSCAPPPVQVTAISSRPSAVSGTHMAAGEALSHVDKKATESDVYKKLFHKDSKKNDKDLFMNVAGFRYGLS
jgi:hypothetical protein